MKPLFTWVIFTGLFLAGCGQTTPTPAGPTATLGGPVVLAATFTQTPQIKSPSQTPTPSPSPSPTSTQALEATPTATLASSPTPTVEVQPSPTPPQETAPSGGSGGQADCVDKAAYYSDITIPDGTSFKQAVTFTKTWQIRNEGTCTWDGYKLVYAGGDIMDGPPSNPMPHVAPGEIANVSVELKSPPQGGEYTGLWEFENTGGQRFGVNSHGKDFIWVKIGVSWYTQENPPGNPKPTPGGPGSAQTGSCSVEQNVDYENQILSLINQARADNGLKALKLQSGLTAAARVHSQDMACNDFIDHTGSDGSTWFNRIQAQQYAYSYASENIYVGDPDFGGDAQGAFTWWMNSEVHRNNILSTKVTSIGIGYAYYPGSTYKGYYTIDFARP